jgi:two-component system OmpR family sensor kinase
MRWKRFGVLIAFLVGLGIDVLLAVLLQPVPILYMRADLGTLALLAGSFLTTLAFVTSVFLDRSDRQKQQLHNQLSIQAADERRRFLRRLDHELKNPLTAIRAGLANLSESPGLEAREEALASVEAQALRLSRLAADLRKLAELETRPLERSPVDIGLVLNEAFSLAQDSHEAGERRLMLTLQKAPWPLPKVSGDQDLLFLALHNLLDNAMKFTRPGDTVEIRSFEDGSMVVVEVADTGPGIPEEELPHVWEELYRGQGARGIPGSGLGLALVRAIAERHNGQVNLRSRTGQGTVFTLKLPVG